LKIPFQHCIATAKHKRKICSHLAIADEGGKKNRNGKTIAVLFCNVFD
jgi:hypothetical protein